MRIQEGLMRGVGPLGKRGTRHEGAVSAQNVRMNPENHMETGVLSIFGILSARSTHYHISSKNTPPGIAQYLIYFQ
jgi:hypothetical protein